MIEKVFCTYCNTPVGTFDFIDNLVLYPAVSFICKNCKQLVNHRFQEVAEVAAP